MQFYEDIVVGKVHRFGAYAVTREEVIAFATKFDPQPFHLDDAAAAQTHFGRLSASGWHTASVVMRLFVEHYLSKVATLPSPGIDELRWLRPVYPGDTLTVETEVLEKRRSQSKPDRGIFTTATRVFNQDGVMVLSMTSRAMVRARDPVGAD